MTIAERMDRLPVTRVHIAIVVLGTLGLFVDIGEVAISNALGVVFLAPPYRVAQSDLSLLLASVFAGGAIGAPVFGWIGDRYGRRTALQLALGLICVSSLGASASPDVQWLTIWRFASGLAIGGYPPLTSAYLSDVLPPARRGMLMMLCAAFGFLGAPTMIFLVRELGATPPLGIEAWRWALATGGVVSALGAALFGLVPESPRWLASVGRQREAEQAALGFERAAGIVSPPGAEAAPFVETPQNSFRMLATPRHRPRLVYLVTLYMLGPWATIGFPLLSGVVLVAKGFPVRESLLFAAVTMFGPTVGNVVAASFIDRIERWVTLAGCATLMIVTGLLFAASNTFVSLVVAGVAFNLLAAVFSASLAVYGAELFPTALRASAVATGWGSGRVISALVPVALLPLLTGYGALAMFGVIGVALALVVALIVLAGPPGLSRKPLT